MEYILHFASCSYYLSIQNVKKQITLPLQCHAIYLCFITTDTEPFIFTADRLNRLITQCRSNINISGKHC